MRINDHYLKLKAGYLFPEIARRVGAFAEKQPGAKIIKLGIGDVTEPLPAACREAMHKAIDEQGVRDTFHGYGPDQGYAFLREKVAEQDYKARGCDISQDDIFISDGSKCDTANVLDILGLGNIIAVCDPVYPVYVDTNVMKGNTGPVKPNGEYDGLVYLPMNAENSFTPALPQKRVDVIYLCYPNNPTGAVADRGSLQAWVDYALANEALILFDAAYEAFITDDAIPHSIYEIPGAKQCAIEFRSFSKNAGFTGTRCAWTVVPEEVTGKSEDGSPIQLHKLWARRQSTKFNGVSYIIQRGAEAVYSEAGQQQVRELVDFYMENARVLREALAKMGLGVFGGVNAPYVWTQLPATMDSWQFFDKLLEEAHVVGTPGSGFGATGEGYFRFSAFNSKENVEEAMARVAKVSL